MIVVKIFDKGVCGKNMRPSIAVPSPFSTFHTQTSTHAYNTSSIFICSLTLCFFLSHLSFLVCSEYILSFHLFCFFWLLDLHTIIWPFRTEVFSLDLVELLHALVSQWVTKIMIYIELYELHPKDSMYVCAD